MRAVVSGATGFIGKRLLTRFAPTDEAVVLTRDAGAAASRLPGATTFAWDPLAAPPPEEALRGADVIFHLAGETVAGRWSAKKKEAIRDSRVVGTRHLVDALANLSDAERPRTLVCASAVGYYGDRGDDELDEGQPAGTDFLATVCREWESEAARAAEVGVRVVSPRIGVVVGAGGGALQAMLTPFKLGVGGRLGDGKQWMPWIHLDDVVGLLLHAAAHDLSGAMNAVAPGAVTNRDFTKALGRALGRPSFLPAPAFALKLALGEFSSALLASQRVVPRVAQATGYRFAHPDLDGALREALGKTASAAPAAARASV